MAQWLRPGVIRWGLGFNPRNLEGFLLFLKIFPCLIKKKHWQGIKMILNLNIFFFIFFLSFLAACISLGNRGKPFQLLEKPFSLWGRTRLQNLFTRPIAFDVRPRFCSRLFLNLFPPRYISRLF